MAINFCANFNCKNKYWCKRYCTASDLNYKDIPNLQSECNESNKYALFKNWKG